MPLFVEIDQIIERQIDFRGVDHRCGRSLGPIACRPIIRRSDSRQRAQVRLLSHAENLEVGFLAAKNHFDFLPRRAIEFGAEISDGANHAHQKLHLLLRRAIDPCGCELRDSVEP